MLSPAMPPRYGVVVGCDRKEVGMGRLIATAMTSLDGRTADEDGRIDWAAPDEEVLAFLNDLERPIGTYLYGRRLYEAMVYWEPFRRNRTSRRPYATTP